MLPPLTVEGETWVFEESAYESFEGYIPKHSSTATKTDTPIIETPQSISVVSRRDMDIRDVRGVGEAVAYTSGVMAGSVGDNQPYSGVIMLSTYADLVNPVLAGASPKRIS